MALKAPRLKDPNIIIRVTNDPSEIEEANRLVCSNYIEEGYWDTDDPFRQNPHMRSEMRTVFVAENGGRVIATASIVKDSREGLPADKTHLQLIKKFRSRGERLAEVSSLAVDKRCTERRNLVIFLFKYLYQYSFYYAHLDRFIISAVAKHAPFYKSVYHFEQLTSESRSKYVKPEVRLVLLTLPLLKAHKVYYEKYELGIADIKQSYYRFMLVDEHPSLRFPDKAQMLRRREIDWVAQAKLEELPLAG